MSICPYFDQDKSYCDVGEDYISPYDVVAMSHYCSGRYQECERFDELADRYPEVLAVAGVPEKTVTSVPVVTPHAHVERTPINIKFSNKWPLSYRLNYVKSCYQSSNGTPREETTTMQAQPIKNRGL